MMKAITRSDIFKQSVFVDNQIALAQQAIHRTINQDDPDEVAYMMPFLDHLQAFHPQPESVNEFCVLAYAGETKEDYENNFPLVMVDLLTRLKIEELYLLTECKNDWKEYEFENKEKQKRFLSMLDGKTDAVGVQFKIKDLPDVLPLFFYTHPEYPHINLISSENDVPVNMLLCKDGNFHTLFDESMHEQLKAAASKAGLMKGSYEVCHTIRNNQ